MDLIKGTLIFIFLAGKNSIAKTLAHTFTFLMYLLCWMETVPDDFRRDALYARATGSLACPNENGQSNGYKYIGTYVF